MGCYLYGSTQRPRGDPLQGSRCCCSRGRCPSQGAWDAVVSSHSPSSHLPQVRCFLCLSILEVTVYLSFSLLRF